MNMVHTKEQLDNLQKVHDFVRDHVKNEQFDMENFRTTNEGYVTPFKGHRDCGTIGCFLGWCPFVLPITKEEITGDFISFFRLSRIKFGIELGMSEWDDLFGEPLELSNRKSNSRLDVLENIQNYINKQRELLENV